MRPDVVVIGGGPAGCSTAIRLARTGMRVRLYEKSRFPRPKLCGGCLSAEAIPELADLGLLELVKSAGAWPIHRVLLSSSNGVRANCDLSYPAFSISRDRLDTILLHHARACGVEVFEGEDGLPHADSARWTVMAKGRSAPTSQLFRDQPFYGIQAVYEGAPGITDQIELDMVPGGYFGLARQEEGFVNVCGLVDQSTMRRAGSDLDSAMRAFAEANPLLGERLRNARRISAWLAVGPVMRGQRRLAEGNTFYVGDAACVVDPFVGEGMAMGLATGRILRNAFQEAPEAPAKVYERLWHKQFDSSRRLQTTICWAIEKPWWQELLAHSCRTFPALMRWLTDNTRPYANIQSDPNLNAV